MRFIDEKPDAKEREIARAQLEQMIHYAEVATCRREFLLGYFGEKFSPNQPGRDALPRVPADRQVSPTEAVNCGGCDNCLSPRQTWDGTLAAQKFLSCVYRIREKSGFGVGLQHVVEVLSGADTEKIRKLDHQSLSTYGIGNEHRGPSGRHWPRIGAAWTPVSKRRSRFNIVELTDPGRTALKSRLKVTLTRPVAPTGPAKHRIGEIACDEALFEKLRGLRKQLADERGVPSYIIFSDVSLRQMARFYPVSDREFSRISGVGDRKLREFGEMFLREIAAHLRIEPASDFRR